MKKADVLERISKGLLEDVPAVIIAAGRGKRLSDGDLPKPLFRLLGMTLLERSIAVCLKNGIEKIYVVVGFAKEKVAAHIEELKARYKVDISVVENPIWQEGNGTSVLAVSPYIKSRFLLLMCDHVFYPEFLSSFLKSARTLEGTVLAVDKRVDQIFDLQDATKVKLDGDLIVEIGKDLTSFDAVDTGVFLCHPKFFDALEEAKKMGDASVTGGVKQLIKGREILAIQIFDQFWIDIDTPKSLDYAKKVMLDGLAKPKEDGFISYHINRKISKRITEKLVESELSPNQLTLLSFLITILASLLFSFGTYILNFLSGFLTQFGSIFDGCDGEVARLKYKASPYGAWLDTVLDRYADTFLGIGIIFGYWKGHPSAKTWFFGVLAIFGFVLISYAKKEYFIDYRDDLPPPCNFIYKLFKRDMRLFVIFLGAILNYPFQVVLVLGFLSHAAVISNLILVFLKR